MQALITILSIVFIYTFLLSLVNKKTIHKEIVKNRVDNLQKQYTRGLRQEDELSKPLSERIFKPLVSGFVQGISKLLPSAGSNNANALKQKRLLEQAGLSMTLDDYNALQLVVIVGGAILGLVFAFSMELETNQVLLYVVLGAYAGFAILRFVIGSQATKRKQALERQLPDMLDLLSVSIEAGLGFEQALLEITKNMEGPLIDEIAVTYREMSMGRTRKDALVMLGERCDVDDVRAFTSALVQAGQLGISIRNVLQAQSVALRKSRRNKIQEEASKLSTKILFPMLIFIFPVLFIVLLGPSLLNIMEML